MNPSAPRAAKVTPISGFPEYLPAERIVEQHFLDVIRETFELHGFPSIETRAVEPVDRLLGKGGDADKEIYARLAGWPATRASGARPSWACTSTSRCPSPATCSRTPASSPSRSGATRSRRCGAASGRRRAATASSPRPTSTSSTWASCRRTSRPRCRSSSPTSSSKLPVGRMSSSRSTTARSPRASTAASASSDVAGTLRIVDKLDKIGPEKVRAMLVEAGATTEQAEQCLALAAIRTERPRLRRAGARPRRASTRPSTRASRRCRGVIQAGMEQRARRAGRRPEDRPRPRLLHRHRLRDPARGPRVVGLVLLRRPLRRAGLRRAHHLPGCRHLDRRLPPAGPAAGQGAADGEPLDAGVRAGRGQRRGGRPTSTRIATALRARGIACEVAPKPAKFGKQIRYAERRGIPYVWFPGAGESGDQVKDIRSGDQVDAEAGSWHPPAEDLRPQILRARE